MGEALERLRPLATGTVLAMFQIAMGEAVEKESDRTLRRAARETKPAPERSGNAAARRNFGRRPAPPRGKRVIWADERI